MNLTHNPHLLTKAAYAQVLLCDELFWMYQNRQDEVPEPGEVTQAILDQVHLIGRCFVMSIDKMYVRQGEVEEDRLLALTDVTQEIGSLESKVPVEIERMLPVMRREKCPDAAIGPHCPGYCLCD